MSIVLVRIDDRLIHGQIVQGWLKAIDINVVLVVSDAVAKDVMQQVLMSMAMPSNVKLDIKGLKEAVSVILGGQYVKAKMMILVANPYAILYMLENGVSFKSLNIGGMHFVSGKRQLLYNFYVDDNDVKTLHTIYRMGVEIEGRVLPEDDRTSIVPVIEKEYFLISKEEK
jgi:PTS system mannose-specific IIB component